MAAMEYILGIETSCDETAAAIVADDGTICANIIAGQTAEHARHGGVVPEVAARAHLAVIDRVIADALIESGMEARDITALAATCGPGLIGGVLVGAMVAKAMAFGLGVPFYAINHLEGHALTARLTDSSIGFPYLLLLVSGGHTQLLAVRGVGDYDRLGTTLDDAAGEAFDKSAQLLGLGMPGGPAIEAAARGGNPKAIDFPMPLLRRGGCDFSFSGLKTAMRVACAENTFSRADCAASLQHAIAASLARQSRRGMDMFRENHAKNTAPYFIAAGGVAANQAVRDALTTAAAGKGFRFYAPPPALCTDNAAMIAWAAIERRKAGIAADGFDFEARPRWPLGENKNENENMVRA